MHSLSPDGIDAPTVIDWLRDPDAVTVIDVRSPAEYETAHIAASYNVPLNLLGEHAAQLAARLDRKVVLACQSGTRAVEASGVSPVSARPTSTCSAVASRPTRRPAVR